MIIYYLYTYIPTLYYKLCHNRANISSDNVKIITTVTRDILTKKRWAGGRMAGYNYFLLDRYGVVGVNITTL